MYNPHLTLRARKNRTLATNPPIGIDWSNSLTQGLLVAYTPGMSLFDIVGRGPMLQPDAGWRGNITTHFGKGSGAGASTQASARAPAPTILQLATQVSYYYYGRFDTTGTFKSFMGVTHNNVPGTSAWAAPFVGWYFRVNSATFEIGWNNNGAYNSNVSGAAPANFKRISLLGTVNMGGNGILYNNGIQVSSKLAGAGPILYGAAPHFFFGASDSGSEQNGMAILGFVWNRILSPFEASILDRDPFQFLIFPDDVVFAQLAPPLPAGRGGQSAVTIITG